jgi:hypothetical protein
MDLFKESNEIMRHFGFPHPSEMLRENELYFVTFCETDKGWLDSAFFGTYLINLKEDLFVNLDEVTFRPCWNGRLDYVNLHCRKAGSPENPIQKYQLPEPIEVTAKQKVVFPPGTLVFKQAR